MSLHRNLTEDFFHFQTKNYHRWNFQIEPGVRVRMKKQPMDFHPINTQVKSNYEIRQRTQHVAIQTTEIEHIDRQTSCHSSNSLSTSNNRVLKFTQSQNNNASEDENCYNTQSSEHFSALPMVNNCSCGSNIY